MAESSRRMRALLVSGFLSLIIALATPTALAAEFSFDPILSLPNLWSLNQDDFQKATSQMPFRWTSTARDSARAAQPGMTLLGRPIVEFIARFQSSRLASLTANFYARGDAGELPKEKFEALIRDAMAAISTTTKAKATERGRDQANAVKAEGIFWKTDTALYTLEYSFTKEVKTRSIPFRAEFVRLEITPPPSGAAKLITAAAPSMPHFNPANHLEHDAATGDVFIKDVPMVDQGQKGYCVVASTERVMRYYGTSVDANELAQIANSDGEGGTSYQAMIAALKKVAARLKVRVREIEKLEVRDILALIKDYNRAAKKAGTKEIPDPGPFLDLNAIYGAMKGDVLRDARTKSKGDLERFQRDVRDNIDRGTPLLWTVYLGVLEDKTVLQLGGGHMRLIIGYNAKTNDIFYSDSWGAGHERKRMSAADAWTITTGLAKIEPL
jgi:hypothetical protein